MLKAMKLFVAIVGAVVFLTSVVNAQLSYPPKLPDAKSHVYKQIADVELKLYVFRPDKSEAKKPRPGIVFFFGGGWVNGSPQQFASQARYLASRGMIAIVADYRVRSRHKVQAEDCVRDAKSAIRWVRAHAAELGIDPDRIVAAGGSAGGHLAACTAVIKKFDEPNEDASVSSCPNALVLFNPALSFDPKLAKDDRRVSAMGERMGVDPKQISPADHVTKDLPPTLILVGSEDFLIEGTRTFVERARQAGARCELDLYPNRSHGFFNLRSKGRADFLATTESMDRFLASLNYVSGTPTAKEFFKNQLNDSKQKGLSKGRGSKAKEADAQLLD